MGGVELSARVAGGKDSLEGERELVGVLGGSSVGLVEAVQSIVDMVLGGDIEDGGAGEYSAGELRI